MHSRSAASVADSLISGLSIYTDNTHTGATTVGGASSIAPSTVGGRRRGKGKGKVREGSVAAVTWVQQTGKGRVRAGGLGCCWHPECVSVGVAFENRLECRVVDLE
jgi:hypothetical protein